MHKEGRTFAQAIKDGNLFRISLEGWGEYCPVACETPREVLECAKRTFHDIKPGMKFKVHRIIGGTAGCLFVEDWGTITA
jgi:hypothetical protein